MIFVGQGHIMRPLYTLLRDLYRNPEKGDNILLRGPSGYGKTTMALEICRYLAGDRFEIYWADMTEFRFRKRVIFIDEVHQVKVPESLFRVMDSKLHVLVFATNHDSVLPEAFSNRCEEYIFDEYSDEELIYIARHHARFVAPDQAFLEIIEAGNRNPRIIKRLTNNLSTYFEEYRDIDSSKANFKEILQKVYSIENGLDVQCRRYLESLENVGGRASLYTLVQLMHVDEGTLKNKVEPVLLRKGLIQITSKGRSLVNAEN